MVILTQIGAAELEMHFVYLFCELVSMSPIRGAGRLAVTRKCGNRPIES